MSYPGDQDPPSHGEWWRPDPGYPTPAQGSPAVPRFPSDPDEDGGHWGGYATDPGADARGHDDPDLRGYQPGRYERNGYGSSPYEDAGGYQSRRGEDAGYGTGQYGRAFDGGSGGYEAGGYQAGGYQAGGYQAGGYEARGYGSSGYSTGGYGSGEYSSGEYSPGESGGRDYGAGGHNPRDYGARDYGAGDYGARDYGTRDYRARDYGTRDYRAGEYGAAGRGDRWERSGYAPADGGYESGRGNDDANEQHAAGGYPDSGDYRPAGHGYGGPRERDYGGAHGGAYGAAYGGDSGSAYTGGQGSPLPAPTPPAATASSPPSAQPALGRFAPAQFASAQPPSGTGSRDPARGFPPAPGAGSPQYPPGEFAAWNSAPDESQLAARGMLSAGAGGAAGAGAAALGGAAAMGGAAASGFADTYGREGSGVAVADDQDAAGWGYHQGEGAGTQAGADEAGSGVQTGTWAYPDQGGTVGYPDDALDAPAPAGSRMSSRRPARPPGGRRKLLIAGVAVLVVALLGGAAVYALSGQGKPVAASSAPPTRPPASKPQPTPSPTLGKWRHIATRAEDPAALTLAELYPATASGNGQSYSRAAERLDRNCPHAVFGTALKAAMHKGQCTQVARASYVSGDGKVMGTIGVVNLINYKAATQVGKVVGSNEFIGPLAAARGPTRNIAKGTGLVQAEIKGHYLILTWAEYANLHQPSKSHDRSVLVTFSNDLIKLTANRSLTNRMVTGQPQT